MVCEAYKSVSPPFEGVAFSSLFIGMVCEAQRLMIMPVVISNFQFPLYRDGV